MQQLININYIRLNMHCDKQQTHRRINNGQYHQIFRIELHQQINRNMASKATESYYISSTNY